MKQYKGFIKEALSDYENIVANDPKNILTFLNYIGLRIQVTGDSKKVIPKHKSFEHIHPKMYIYEAIDQFMKGEQEKSKKSIKSYEDFKLQNSHFTMSKDDKIFCEGYFNFLKNHLENCKCKEKRIFNKIFHLGDSHCLSYANSFLNI